MSIYTCLKLFKEPFVTQMRSSEADGAFGNQLYRGKFDRY